jgi:hypothetical protein
MRIACLLVAILLAACSTPYQDMGLLGGVEAQQITSSTFRIVARGNGYTGSTAIQDYAMLKAAETTRQHGGTHFAIIGERDASAAGYMSTPGYAQTNVIGNTAFTTYTPGSVHQYLKPGQDLYIRIFTVATNQAPPGGTFSADEIIRFVGGRVQRPS